MEKSGKTSPNLRKPPPRRRSHDPGVGLRAHRGNAEQPAGLGVAGADAAAEDAARAASSPACGPCARREPKSKTARPPPPIMARAAFEATSVCTVSVVIKNVSTSWAWASGAVTRSSGSPANTAVPSGTAHTSPAKRKVGQPVEPVRAGQPESRMIAEIIDLFGGEGKMPQVVDVLFQPGGDEKIAARGQSADPQLERARWSARP